MKTQSIIALKFLVVMTILTGILYPVFMTGIAQLAFPYKANGSLIKKDGKIIGSELIGQKFDSSAYFWSRPSAIDYNPVPSAASNLGPTSDKLKKQVTERRHLFAETHSLKDTLSVPKEMVFASGSGLDPQISPEAAMLQVKRIVAVRKFNASQEKQLITAIQNEIEEPQLGILGEKRINVLFLNIALDDIK